MKTKPVSVFNDRDTSGSASYITQGKTNPTGTVYSDPWSADTYGLHVEYTGTLTGALTQWVSDKPDPDRTSDDDWIEDSAFTPTDPAGSPGKFRDDVTNSNARWKRLKYEHSSGSGKLYAHVTGVSLG